MPTTMKYTKPPSLNLSTTSSGIGNPISLPNGFGVSKNPVKNLWVQMMLGKMGGQTGTADQTVITGLYPKYRQKDVGAYGTKGQAQTQNPFVRLQQYQGSIQPGLLQSMSGQYARPAGRINRGFYGQGIGKQLRPTVTPLP